MTSLIMQQPETTMTSPMDWLRIHGRHQAVEIIVNVGLPFLAYQIVAPRAGNTAGLLASSAPPTIWALLEFARRRRVDALSMLVLCGIVLSLLALLGGGSARLLQVREHMVTALIGIVFLGSAAAGRPLIYQLARAGLARRTPQDLAAFEARRDKAEFRRMMTIMTLVWGSGLLGSAMLASVLVFVVSARTNLIIGPVIGYGTLGALSLWTAQYRRRMRRRTI